MAHWDVAATDVSLVSRTENDVFRVETAGPEAFVLRIHRPGYSSLAELNSECQWVAALRDAGVQTPRHVPTAKGENYAAIRMPGGSVRHVGLLDWVPGELLADRIDRDGANVAGWYERLGRIAATIHNHSSGWQPPREFVRRQWDADGLMGSDPIWGRFWEIPQLTSEDCGTLLRARHAIHDILSDLGTTPDIYSLIHSDMHPQNVLVDGDRLTLIDFDDSGFGWHLYELAVALFRTQGQPYHHAAAKALIAGYRAERPLTEAMVSLIPVFVLIRGLVVLGWAETRSVAAPEKQMSRFRRRVVAQAQAFLEGQLRI